MDMQYPQAEGNQVDRVRYLIAGFIRKTLTEAEEDELDEWVSASDENLLLFEELTDENQINEHLQFLDQLQPEAARERIKLRIGLHKRSSRFWVYAAAATVLLFLAGVGILQYLRKDKVTNPAPISQQDVAPGRETATLTLGDGRKINLTESGSGFVEREEGVHIRQVSAGTLAYIDSSGKASAPFIHRLKTPRGGQFSVRLPDGSQVWLNAASELRFPSRFSGHERIVELEGEGYFEVARNPSQPFIVRLRDSSQVRVMGTSFNIMSYPDEPGIATTLLEGSVTVGYHSQLIKMSPGQQVIARGKPGDKISLTLNPAVHTEEVMAWKQGNFDFRNVPIETIMKQVSRWYDVEIHYEGKISQLFTADISRQEPLSKLLRFLELTGKVHFNLKNKTVYVLP